MRIQVYTSSLRPGKLEGIYTLSQLREKEGESILTYVAELKKLSTERECGDSLNGMIISCVGSTRDLHTKKIPRAL